MLRRHDGIIYFLRIQTAEEEEGKSKNISCVASARSPWCVNSVRVYLAGRSRCRCAAVHLTIVRPVATKHGKPPRNAFGGMDKQGPRSSVRPRN